MALEPVETYDNRITEADREARTPGLQHDTDLPPARERMGMMGRILLSTAAVIPGLVGVVFPLGILLGFAGADAADVGPGASEETTLALWMQACAGISIVVAGWFIWVGRMVPVAVSAVIALLFGILGWAVL